jgi:ABC-type branched-subunit amino acid transport system ATPase component
MDKELCKIDEIVSVETDIMVMQWMDNFIVLMASNFIRKGNADQVRHWNKVQKDYIQVNRPRNE